MQNALIPCVCPKYNVGHFTVPISRYRELETLYSFGFQCAESGGRRMSNCNSSWYILAIDVRKGFDRWNYPSYKHSGAKTFQEKILYSTNGQFFCPTNWLTRCWRFVFSAHCKRTIMKLLLVKVLLWNRGINWLLPARSKGDCTITNYSGELANI